jgi:hypothetical protein
VGGSVGVSPESVQVDTFLEMRARHLRFLEPYVIAFECWNTLRSTMSLIAALPKSTTRSIGEHNCVVD